MITFLRLIIAPVFYWMLVSGDPNYIITACLLFLAGSITDYLDGWYARKFNVETKYGKFFDPLADKFLTTAAFLAFYALGIVELWMVLVILFRDVLTTLLRVFPGLAKRPLKTSNIAKVKTFSQMVFISLILALIFCKTAVMPGEAATIDGLIYSVFSYYIMLGLVVMTLWSLISYLIQLFK